LFITTELKLLKLYRLFTAHNTLYILYTPSEHTY